jgi:hypothetical protein
LNGCSTALAAASVSMADSLHAPMLKTPVIVLSWMKLGITKA